MISKLLSINKSLRILIMFIYEVINISSFDFAVILLICWFR
ncbi:hypothetical protein P147_WWE3C00001G0390 [candidate division WWE3 bacterium RAAC2_WWE3_1]|nr:hypothetical protein P147_WWE3C00001G0390 [candidate division WWE3 bacterium RAAC2_WWE3_1]